jgi:hypothetical protein
MSQAEQRKRDGLSFCSHPLHAYISGDDCAVIPASRCAQPSFDCGAKMGAADYVPGPHATWDCVLLYWKVLGCCPGFSENGRRDPAQWRGNNLTLQAKDGWIALIARKISRCREGSLAWSHPTSPRRIK